MADTSYTGSELDDISIITCLEPDLASLSDKDLDFDNEWVNQTVYKEVSRGAKLRKLKSKPILDEYDISINFNKLPCREKNSYRKRNSERYTEIETNSCNPRLKSSYWRANSPFYYCGTPSTCISTCNTIRKQKPKRCPMRIMELAVPTKRQCIETWRNKSNVLPGFMVERLKQQVMDEKPIVKIADALQCFKIRSSSSKRSCKKFRANSKKQTDYMLQLRQFSAIFGHRIARKLIIPLNITLNSQLEKISTIVSDEITKILRNIDTASATNKRIQNEMSKKITVWISNILEDTSYKLLEEDLRDLEEEEGPVLDFIDDLVDNVMNICEPNESITEDQPYERSIVSPKSLENIDFDTSGSNQIYGSIYSTRESTAIDKYSVNDEKDSITSTVEQHMSNELYHIINKITGDTSQDKLRIFGNTDQNLAFETLSKTYVVPSSEHFKLNKIAMDEESKDDEINIENINVISNEDDVVNMDDINVTSNKDDENNIDSKIVTLNEDDGNNIDIMNVTTNQDTISIPNDEVIKIPLINDINVTLNEGDKNNLDIINVTTNQDTIPITNDEVIEIPSNIKVGEEPVDNIDASNSGHENVSASFEVHSEDSTNESNKKVKFSEVDMAVGEGITGPIETRFLLSQDQKQDHPPWKKSEYITFASPNKHLLCDADETWPQDIHTPTLKISASVSKSVTSLGKIIERDEKLLSPEDKMLGDQPTIKSLEDTNATSEITGTLNHDETQQSVENFEEKDIYLSFKISNNNLDISMLILKESQPDKTIDTVIHTDEIEENKSVVVEFSKLQSEIQESVRSPTILDDLRSIERKSFLEKNYTKHNQTGTVIESTKNDMSEISQSETTTKKPVTISKISDDFILCDTSSSLAKASNETPRTATRRIDVGDVDTKVKEAVQDKLKFYYGASEGKFDYRVHPHTAPSWVKSDLGKGEPSEEFFLGVHKGKPKINESDIRNWSKNLENIFINLELWNSWIKNTCKTIIHVNQKSEFNKIISPSARKRDVRNWIKLKQNIDKDAMLWTKLNQRAQERLKTYKYIYEQKTKISSCQYLFICDCKNPARFHRG